VKRCAAILLTLLLCGRAQADWQADWQVDGEAGAGYDDNANNWSDFDDRRESPFEFATVNLTRHFWPASSVRLDLRGGLAGEHWEKLSGLSNARASGGVRVFARPGAEFEAPTVVLSGTVSTWQFDSDLRDGNEVRVSLALLQPLTTELSARLTAGANWRDADSDVFDLSTHNVGVGLEWRVSDAWLIYGGDQLIMGDVVSSGPARPSVAALAHAKGDDDAFPGEGFVAYRVDARTQLATLGATFGLSRNWSLDGRVQHADSLAVAGERYRRWITTASVLARF
jgi:hypothetical protein